MQKLGFILVFLTLVGTNWGWSQGIPASEVPAAVVSSFEKASHGATAEWSQAPGDRFEATFVVSDKRQVLEFDSKGLLVAKKMEASETQLPTSIGRALAINFPLDDVGKMYWVIGRDKKKYYEVCLENDAATQRVRYDLAGNQFALVATPKSKPIIAANGLSRGMELETGPTAGGNEDFPDDEVIDEDIADLFADDPLYNDDLDYELEGEIEDEEDWEKIIFDEEDDDLEFGWDDPQVN